MKRITSLFLLLMAMIAPLAMNAQGTLTIGTGTGYAIHSGNSGSPMGDTYYYYATSQSIYTATELGGARTITSVAFYHNAGYLMDATINIYLAHTTASTVDATNPATTGTLVYTGTNITLGSSNAEWQVFDFSSTPFEYNGTDNLLVIVCRTKKTAGSNQSYNSSLGWQYTTTSGNMFMHRSSDTSGYDNLSNTSYSYTASTNRPNIQIGYTTTEPYINLDPTSEIVKTGFSKTITATYGNVTNPTITYSSSNTSVATVTGSGTTATVTGVSAGTATITATMNGTYTATCDITVEDPAYCTPGPTSIDGSGITNVTFGTNMVVNDNLSMTSSPYYYDHSNQIGAAYPGATIQMSIVYATNYTYYTWVWVDWNSDYEFDDTELVYPSTQTISSGTLTVEFAVPTTATLGDYRMRIQGADANSKKNPCYTGSYSYLVDYTLRVEAAPSCMPPTGLTVVGTPTAHGVNVQWNSTVGETFNYAIELGTGIDPETVTYAGSITATSTTCSMSWNNLMYGDSDYTVFIRKDCGNGDYSTAATLVIHTAVACPAPVDFTAVVNGTSVTLSWTGAQSDIAWSLNPSVDPDDYIDPDFDIDQAHGTATMSNMALDTDYYFWVRTNCGGIDGTSTWVGPVSVHIGYCVPNPSGRDGKGITKLTFGSDLVVNNIDETNGLPASAPYYGNYTNMVGSAEPGSNVNVSITYATGSGTVYSYGTIIWVDWDNSLSFEDSEIVYTGTSAQGSGGVPQVLDASFTVPANQASGDYRMRIAGADSYFDDYIGGSTTANHSACFSSSYAVCHDYTLRVAQVSCPAPTPGSVTDLMPTSATLNWTSDADDFYVRYRTAAHDEETFFDDFESGSLNGWTVYTNGESLLDLGVSYEGWFVYNLGENHGDGSYVANAWSYYQFDDETYGTFDADNWLITPQVTLGGTLKFWVWANYSDEFEVLLSTSSTATSDFTTTLRSMQAPSASNTWEEVSIDLSSYSGQGYIAIHHVFENGWYLLVDDFGIYADVEAGQWLPNATGDNTSDNSLDITGLTPETEYEWQVMADCGTDGESNWSTIATFTTPSPCAAPSNPNTTDITAASAKLNWTGAQENYNVVYGKVLFYDGFESGNLTQDGWTVYTEGESPNTDGWYAYNASSNWTNHNGTYSASAWSWSSSSYNADNWLVTPQVALQGTLSFWVYANYADEYEVLLSTGGNTTSDFNVTLQTMAGAPKKWTEITIDLSSYNGAQGYIAIHHVFNDGNVLLVDDFGIYDLQSTTSTASNVTVNGLEPMTDYTWKVQGVNTECNDGVTDWSDYVFFTTAEGYIKHIVGYGTSQNGGYELIASPIGNVSPTNVTNMIGGSYDLFSFDQEGDANGKEWLNYKVNTFQLESGKGYLYANSQTVDLVFTGSAPSTDDVEVSLTLADGDFPGLNLVGNPFAVTAYIADDRDFYTMNADGNMIVEVNPESRMIEAMQGVFVVAEYNGEHMTFTTEEPEPVNNGKMIALHLSQGNNVIDRAVVRFGESRQLPKFQLNSNSTKLYIPLADKDYAVVSSEEMGEMPVSFKAEENGTYTINLSIENVEFGYLHLIDNMTGNDVDLLSTPSYSFEARTTDYANRFKLVFATGNAEDDFAFYSNGSYVINNEGNATVQVIDINGRILSSESINGCANINVNAAAGVYMIRLVNGNDVKVQKVVVR